MEYGILSNSRDLQTIMTSIFQISLNWIVASKSSCSQSYVAAVDADVYLHCFLQSHDLKTMVYSA